MVKLRYKGAMAKGLAVCPGFKIGVERNTVYDIPSNASKHFLATRDWEKTNIPKEKPKKEIKKEVIEEEPYDIYKEEVE